MQHDFEDVEIKENAIELLEMALKKKRKPCMIGTGAMTDPYMPMAETLFYTRRCLELIEKHGFGLAIQTKSALILKDLDLLKAIHKKAKCVVQMTLTTYDDALCQVIEPNVSTTSERFETLMSLKEAGIPTVVWLTPFLPFINDTLENLDGLMRLCTEADVKGILFFGVGMTLRAGNREYYYAQIDRHFPGLKAKYEKTFKDAYVCNSPNHKALSKHVIESAKKAGMLYKPEAVFDYLHTYESKEEPDQLSFFDWL